MAEPPRIPPDDETVVVPSDETVVADQWAVRPEGQVIVEETETVPPRRMPTIWPWLLALLLLVLGGLGALYYFSQDDDDPAATTSTVARAEVPVLIGLRQARAEEHVRAAGFEPKVERKQSGKPKGVVFDQEPNPGTELERGEEVLMVVSNGPPKEQVPDVVGQPVAEAVEDLQAAGLRASQVAAFGDAEKGVVLKQDPAGGAKLTKGATVALTVSKGRQPVAVPDVVGTTSSEATSTLRAAGFEVNLVPVPSDQPAGTVVAQSPAAGTEAPKGETVRLNVAQKSGATTPPPSATTSQTTTQAQPQKTTVPDALGKELAVAAREFAAAGLKIAVKYVPSQDPAGRVVAQAQPAGTERNRGDTVQVNVSIGPNPAEAASVPNVVGGRQAQGRAALEQAGFEVLAVSLTGEVRNESVVESQTPAAGASIPRGSLVLLYVR